MTECNQQSFAFHPLNRREVVARFDGGHITSDGGGLLLREVERRTNIVHQFAACFTDHRDGDRIEHSVEELIGQRVYGLALGYEDLNDHDDLRHDPLLAMVSGKVDPTGQGRRRERDKGKALAGKSTLNRLELTPVRADEASRYKKIVADTHAIGALFTELFIQGRERMGPPPDRIVLDLDATDDPVHGEQLGRFFHGYYGHYCYLPLYIFCGDDLLCARLRPSNIDASAGALKEVIRIVRRIRQRWPNVQIVLRGDSGFCRDGLMSWCEENAVDFIFGLARNARLEKAVEAELEQARVLFEQTGQAARVFKDFEYQTHESWSRSRCVVGKAEHLAKGPNPRFVVASLPASEIDARTLYEQEYCARGEMENRIKEQQLHLFADRTSAATMRANQLRMWFSAIAYSLTLNLRRMGLQGTELEKAQPQTIRLKLLKIGALVRVTARKVWLMLSTACPYRRLFAAAHDNLLQLLTYPMRC